MAPEVFLGKQYTEKADVYSYGLILFELITGLELFPGLQPWVAVRKVANDGLRPPVELVQPPELQELIQDCWNGTPEARPSFKEILSRLRAIVSKELNLRTSQEEQLVASSASPP
jgi:serine/threonine protein kinase